MARRGYEDKSMCDTDSEVPLSSSDLTMQGNTTQITKFMGPTSGPPGSCRPQMGPMLAPWPLLSGHA